MVEAFGIVAAGNGCDGLRAKPCIVFIHYAALDRIADLFSLDNPIK